MTAAQHTIATQAATTSLSGYLATADWNTFNGKEDVLTAGDGLERTGDTLSVDYNTTNLKFTANEINTIQDISASSDVTFNKATITTDMVQNNLTRDANSQALEDEAEIVLATGNSGMALIWIGNFEEYALVGWTAEGVVTLILNSTNVANSDTDGNLCIYDKGTGPAIKNRLGASKTIRYCINFS